MYRYCDRIDNRFEENYCVSSHDVIYSHQYIVIYYKHKNIFISRTRIFIPSEISNIAYEALSNKIESFDKIDNAILSNNVQK